MADRRTTTGRTILTEFRTERLLGVRLLDPESGTDGIFDIQIGQGRIRSIAPSVHEASGLLAFPGLTDMHVHLRIPGGEEAETFHTGLRAAVAGGVTSIGMMPNTSPPLDSVTTTMELAEAASLTGLATVKPVPCLTLGRAGRELVDLEGFADRGVRMFTDDGSPLASDDLFIEAMERMSTFGGTLMEHPEMMELSSGGSVNLGRASTVTGAKGIPESAEYEDVERCIGLLAKSSGKAGLHLTHLSSPRSVEKVREAASAGLPVTCDVTPHHLVLSEEELIAKGPTAKMNPPLRAEASRSRLAEFVLEGAVNAIATDHAPHPARAKAKPLHEAAFGVTGLETMLPLTFELLVVNMGMELLDFLRMLTETPASLLGVPRTGLSPGSPCRLVLFDPGASWEFNRTLSLSANSPFLGRTLRGKVLRVWNGGEIFREGRFV